jgi:hypothetical protein
MTVTVEAEGSFPVAEIPLPLRLAWYTVGSVPAPANLWGTAPIPTRHVHEIKVKTEDGWIAL